MAKKDSFLDQAKALVQLPGAMYSAAQAAQRAKTQIPAARASRRAYFDKKKYDQQFKKTFNLKGRVKIK